MSGFYGYVHSFYGPDGLYPMGATLADIQGATNMHIDNVGAAFEGDSMDREAVRDILIKAFRYEWPVKEQDQ